LPTLYLTEDRALVRRDTEDCLLVQVPEKRGDGGELTPAYKKRIPLVKIDDVVVMGEITMTASAIHMLLEKNIEIHFLGYYGQFKGRLTPGLSKNSLLRMAQHRAHIDLSKRCELARRFVIGKLSNQRTMLQRYNRRQTEPQFNEKIDQITSIIRQLSRLSATITTTPTTLTTGDSGIEGTPLETILGLEGASSAAYFHCFSDMLSDKQQWSFAGRVKRPPTDPVNALLSYGYTLLTSQVSSAVQMIGFDQFIGYLHSSVYGRPALALDLMEEFRPIIVDSVVLTLLNNRMLTKDDFQIELGAYRLKKEPRKTFLTRFEERLNEEITHPIFGYKVKYRRCLELQARLLAKYLTGEINEYPPFITR
jgi:CRISPR-associated protein Cas1